MVDLEPGLCLLLQERKLGFVPLAGTGAGPPHLRWPLGHGGTVDPSKGRREGSVFSRFFNLVRVCVLLRKARRRRLPEDGIKVSPPSPRSGGASSIVGGRVEVCLRQIYLWWICSDLVVVRLRSCVFGLDPSDLRYFSSAAVPVLGCWSYGP